MSWKKALIFYIIGFILWAAYSSDVYAKDDMKGDTDKKKVEELVTAYYEAHTAEGMETLQDYVEDGKSAAEEIMVLEVCLESGVKKYGNLDVAAYPLSDGITWTAVVSYELIVEDFDIGIPGLKTLVVHKQKDGTFKIVGEDYFDDMDDSKWEELQEEIWELMLSNEIYDQYDDIYFRYNTIVSENPDISEWIIDLQDKVEQAYVMQVEDHYTKLKSETDAGAQGIYVVREGDCLWSIAEEQLGDGMYWSSIYEDNRELIGDDPNLLYVGWELILMSIQ